MAPDIDIEMLIHEVQIRPAIYNTSVPEYRDKQAKRNMWDEVCCNVYSAPVWTSMTANEKIQYGMEIQTKWNSLRTCFRRELATQRNTRVGNKKKRKYIYFNLLQFLLPFTAIENNETPIETVESSESLNIKHGQSSDCETVVSQPNKKRKIINIRIENEQSPESIHYIKQEPTSDSEGPVSKRLKKRPKNFDEDSSDDEYYLELPTECNQLMNSDKVQKLEETTKHSTISGDNDEDQSFLRSLLPYMRQFSPDEKLQLRIELLQTVLNFKKTLVSSASNYQRQRSSEETAHEHTIVLVDPLLNSNISDNDKHIAKSSNTEPSNSGTFIKCSRK